MEVGCVMLPIAFDVHAEIERNTPETVRPEPLHLTLDLHNQAITGNDKKIINAQNDRHTQQQLYLMLVEAERMREDNTW
jgi:hypothetical protein